MNQLTHEARHAGALKPHVGCAEIAEHQRVVKQRVQRDANNRHDVYRPWAGMGGQKLREDSEQQRREKSPEQITEIGLAVVGDVRFLAEEHEDRAGPPGGDGDRDRQQQCKPCGIAHHGPDLPGPAGAQVLGHDRRCAGQHAHREGTEYPVEVARQRARGEGLGADPSHHDDIGQHDGHVRQVGQGQGSRERGDCPGFTQPGPDGGRRLQVHGSEAARIPGNERIFHDTGHIMGAQGFRTRQDIQVGGFSPAGVLGYDPAAVPVAPCSAEKVWLPGQGTGQTSC